MADIIRTKGPNDNEKCAPRTILNIECSLEYYSLENLMVASGVGLGMQTHEHNQDQYFLFELTDGSPFMQSWTSTI